MTREEEHEAWLKAECNRYINGQCLTLRCMRRGGFTPGQQYSEEDYSKIATCEAHEILERLKKI